MSQETRSEYNNDTLEYYESVSSERVLPVAPVVFYDDFIYPSTVIPAAGSLESGVRWAKKIVGTTTVALGANSPAGTAICTLDATSEKQDAVLYAGDQRQWCLDNGLVLEMRVKLPVLPTLAAECVWGLVGDWADGPDAITFSAFFTADGSGEIFCEMDDNATDRSATSGVTVIADQYVICRVDASDKENVKYYINGTQVATATTFTYAGSAGANSTLQPYVAAYKASGAGVGTVTVDYVRLWQANRT